MYLSKSDRKLTREFVFTATNLTQTLPVIAKEDQCREVVKMIVTIPNWTENISTVIKMFNSDNKEIFTTGTLNRNQEYDINLCPNECIIMGGCVETWSAELSGNPGGSGGTISMTLYLKVW